MDTLALRGQIGGVLAGIFADPQVHVCFSGPVASDLSAAETYPTSWLPMAPICAFSCHTPACSTSVHNPLHTCMPCHCHPLLPALVMLSVQLRPRWLSCRW